MAGDTSWLCICFLILRKVSIRILARQAVPRKYTKREISITKAASSERDGTHQDVAVTHYRSTRTNRPTATKANADYCPGRARGAESVGRASKMHPNPYPYDMGMIHASTGPAFATRSVIGIKVSFCPPLFQGQARNRRALQLLRLLSFGFTTVTLRRLVSRIPHLDNAALQYDVYDLPIMGSCHVSDFT